MLVLVLLVHHVLGQESLNQSEYGIRNITSCPDEGYYFQQERQDLQDPQDSGLCHLCFCEDGNKAVCWKNEGGQCNETYHRVGRRDLRHFWSSKTVLDETDTAITKNTLEQEECIQPGRVLNLDCPPDDWCKGCNVCYCLNSGKWKCKELKVCDDERLQKKLMKRNIYRLLTDTPQKNYTSSRAIFHKAKKDRFIKVQHEKEIPIPEEIYTKNKGRITIQHTKEILEQKEISAKMKEERTSEHKIEVVVEHTTHQNPHHLKRCKESATHSYKMNKSKKTVNTMKDNKNNTLRKEITQAKMIFMNTKQNKKVNKHQAKLANKPLQETHKLSVRHISIHSDKHKSRITKRHDSKTYMKNPLDKSNKVKQDKIFFKSAYCNDSSSSKRRLTRRKRRVEDEVTADDIVTLSNETDSDLYIAVPGLKSNDTIINGKEDSSNRYFAYKVIDDKKDAKSTRAVKDYYFPFIDGLENVINKLNEINKMTLSEQQEKTAFETEQLLDHFDQIHSLEDPSTAPLLNRTKLNYTKKKKLSGKDVVRKLKVKSGMYKTLKQIDFTKDMIDFEEIEFRQYLIKVLSLLNDQSNGRMMLLNHKRLKALKFLRELLKDMFYQKQNNMTKTNYEKEILNLMCSNFGPCLIGKEKVTVIKSNSKVLYMEVIKMLRTVKIIKDLLNHVNRPKICDGKAEFNCDLLTLTTVIKKSYNKSKTHEEIVLVNSIRQNTKSFVRSVEHFIVIFNNLLSIVTRNGTVTKPDTVPEATNDSTKQLFKKLKRLISMYRLSENRFLKSIVAAIPAEKNATAKINKKEVSPADTMNIMSKLRKLKNLAEAVISQNKQRSKRSLDYDTDVVEYLLNVMEYIVKQSALRNQVTDGIDLLIDTIEKSPNVINFNKNKQNIYSFPPQRTTTKNIKVKTFKKLTYDINKPNFEFVTELHRIKGHNYVTDNPELIHFTTLYPMKYVPSEKKIVKQKGESDSVLMFERKHFTKVKDEVIRGKRPKLRLNEEGKPNYVPMRTTTTPAWELRTGVEPVEPLDLELNAVDYIDELTESPNNTTPLVRTDLIHRSFSPSATESDVEEPLGEDVKLGDKQEVETEDMSKEKLDFVV